MIAVKIAFAGVVGVLTLLIVTYIYVAVVTSRGPQDGGSVGVDIAIIPSLTVYSPLYWLVVAVVAGMLWWLFHHWLFS